jgi:hypothetical protein
MNHMIHINAMATSASTPTGARPLPTQASRGQEAAAGDQVPQTTDLRPIYNQLLDDAQRDATPALGADQGGHRGATVQSSATDLPPHIDTSHQQHPGPAQRAPPLRVVRKGSSGPR